MSRFVRPLLLVTGLCGMLGGAASPAAAADSKTTGPIIPIFKLESVTEAPLADDPLFGSVAGETLSGLVRRMDKAGNDPEVKGVVLMLGGASLGYGQVEELRQAIARMKSLGKPVYAHADSLSTGDYALLCGASRLSVSPTGDMLLTGIYGEQLYLRGLFDKLDIQPDFLTCGAYKSAAEMFMRTGPSEEAAAMYGWLYDGMYDTVLRLIAEGRGVTVDQAKQWIDDGIYSAERAQKAGLIDAVEFKQDFEAFLRDKYGADIAFERSYGKPKGLELDLNNPFAAFQLWAQILSGPQTKKSTKDAVAIVYVEGGISVGEAEASPFAMASGAYSEPIRKALDEAARDEKIKAVVLRVDSPGGSAIASEIILNATRRVKEKKPLVVSMGNVAGSGGYYVACAADTIFADTSTITGSIGVVTGKLATNAMWEKFGVNFEPVAARGKNSAMLYGGNPFTNEEKQALQGWMDEVYEVFKGHVVAIRGDRLKKPIDELAGGRVYTGQQALELGLVDKIGTLQDAVAFAAELGKVSDYDLRMLPAPVNPLESLLGGLTGEGKKDEQHLSLPQLADPAGLDGLRRFALPALRELEPQRARLLEQALQQLRILQTERVSLTMPLIDAR